MKKIIILFFISVSWFCVFGIAKAQDNSRLYGKILLQVEEKGEAWYVNSGDGKRYFLGRPNDAFDLMRQLGIGISNMDLERIMVADEGIAGGKDSDGDKLSDMIEDSIGTDKNKKDTDSDGYDDWTEVISGYNPLGGGKIETDTNLAKRLSGRILLQVERNGEAWYVNPSDNRRYFLGRPQDAFNLMRKLGLGITNSDLDKIDIMPVSKKAVSRVDCGKDMDCFIELSNDCSPAVVNSIITIDFFGATQSTDVNYDIEKGDSGKCVFGLVYNSIDWSYSEEAIDAMKEEGLTQEEINLQLDEIKKVYDGLTGDRNACRGETSDITAMLMRWQNGKLSTGDWDDFECSGRVFEGMSGV